MMRLRTLRPRLAPNGVFLLLAIMLCVSCRKSNREQDSRIASTYRLATKFQQYRFEGIRVSGLLPTGWSSSKHLSKRRDGRSHISYAVSHREDIPCMNLAIYPRHFSSHHEALKGLNFMKAYRRLRENVWTRLGYAIEGRMGASTQFSYSVLHRVPGTDTYVSCRGQTRCKETNVFAKKLQKLCEGLSVKRASSKASSTMRPKSKRRKVQ